MSFIHEQVRTFVDRINSRFIPGEIESLKYYANLHNVPVLYDESLVFLRFLTQIHSPKRILEIGTAIGYSGSAMLLCSKNSMLFTIEIDETAYYLAAEHFKSLDLSHRVRQYLGDAAFILGEFCKLHLEHLSNSKSEDSALLKVDKNIDFDMIFIDAAKAQYLEYFKLCEPLMSDTCVVVFDNVLYKGIVVGLPHTRRNNTIGKRLNELFSYIEQSKRYEMSLLGMGDGILLVKQK